MLRYGNGKEKAMVLLFSLLLVFILTLLVSFTMEDAWLQLKLASHSKNSVCSFNAAESTLLTLKQQLMGSNVALPATGAVIQHQVTPIKQGKEKLFQVEVMADYHHVVTKLEAIYGVKPGYKVKQLYWTQVKSSPSA